MQKLIKFHTSEGVYSLPAILVAQNRANYFSLVVKGHRQYSEEYEEEVNFALDNEFELLDWLINYTIFEDWKDKATKTEEISCVSVDDLSFWSNVDNFEFIFS